MSTPSPYLAPVPDTPVTILKRKWKELQTQAVGIDVSRGEVLAEAIAAGVTQVEMARELEIDQSYVSSLLCYYEFVTFVKEGGMTAVIPPMPEGRFREYWRRYSDPRTNKAYQYNAEERTKYRRRVFRLIADLIQAGDAPQKLVKPAKPKTARQIRQALDLSRAKEPLAALRKEIRHHYYGDLKKTLDTMEKLLSVEHAASAPSRAVHGPSGSEEMLNQTQ